MRILVVFIFSPLLYLIAFSVPGENREITGENCVSVHKNCLFCTKFVQPLGDRLTLMQVLPVSRLDDQQSTKPTCLLL
jgi:hypothetical protein